MAINYNLPPDPQNAVLKRIYPWDEYDVTLVMQWLFTQAKKTGFVGTFDDFKLQEDINKDYHWFKKVKYKDK